MYQILDHGSGEVFGRIHETGSWRGPAAAITVASFSIERVAAKGSLGKRRTVVN
jgi:hypothetical protein